MGNGMNKVMPGLFIGNYRDSKDYSQLERFNITHILSVHDTARKLYPDKHYLCVSAEDNPDQNLSQYFSLCNDFIHAARLRNGNVLIHCLAGMSRSVTVAVAYIISVTSLDWKQALKVIRVNRAVANPNYGFQKQLQEFEYSKLSEERKRLKERFPSTALVSADENHCSQMLKSYQHLLVSKHLCEGHCSRGEICPTGVCNLRTNRKSRRKYSVEQPSTSRTCQLKNSVLVKRPQSGPPVLISCGDSAPPTRASSKLDLYEGIEKSKKIQSAPTTPQQSPQHKQHSRVAPLVNLDEIAGL